MANELSLNQTVQAEVGEFNSLYVGGEEITIGGDISIDELPDLVNYQFGIIQANNVLLGTWSNDVFTQDYDVRQTLVDYGNNISSNASAIQSNADSIQTNAGNISSNTSNISSNTSRISALEAASFDSSIVDNLSTSVQALQTRTGTLESLIGLLTNNNTNDTDIEHRITRIEKTILALKAIHDAKKSVYNIPLDW